jgi:hypothetical protein
VLPGYLLPGKLGETAATCDKQRVKYEKVAKTLIAMKAGIEHLADKLEGIKLDAPPVELTDDTVVEVLAQCESKLLKTYSELKTNEETASMLTGHADASLGVEDLPQHNSRIANGDQVVESDEEDDDGSDVEDALDVPDREYVKTTAHQMTNRKGKKSRGMDEAPTSPAAGQKRGMQGKASRGTRPNFE